MLKVLSIASYQFLPPLMGGQKGIAFFNRHLAKYVSLTCVTIPANVKACTDEPYEMIPLLSGSVLRYINLFYFFKLKKLIRQKGINCVLLEHPYYGWLGYLLQRFLKVKLVIHSHNIEALRFKSFGKWWWKLMWRYEKWVYKSADYNFFISAEDRSYAIEHLKIPAEKTAVITYGILQSHAPAQAAKKEAKQEVCSLHTLNPNHLLLLYSATLYYGPNLEGLDAILNEINPVLQSRGIDYNIIICGSHLPDSYQKLQAYANDNILYAGFVDDIDLYFRAADVFLNPLSEGGGIKTKLVEALAGNSSAVSFTNGAYGVPQNITGGKLKIVADKDSPAFAEAIIQSVSSLGSDISPAFFDHFYWGNIAAKAAGIFNTLQK